MTYPTSDHEWVSVEVLKERDAEIERLRVENGRLRHALELAVKYNPQLRPLVDEAMGAQKT